jgi:decaprenylphospho-beta-D-erythro-pentofuranosid-2-ulose 2-reductase
VRTVLVLGDGSEPSLATARALVRRDARTVVLAGRRPRSLDGAAAELRHLGATTVETVAFDPDDLETHPAFVVDVCKRYGDIDLALIGLEPPEAGLDPLGDGPDGGRAVAALHTAFLGAASVALPVARCLAAQGHGTLAVLPPPSYDRAPSAGRSLQPGAGGARRARPDFVRRAGRAGLDALCRGLGDALAGTGVRVLLVRARPSRSGHGPEAIARDVVAALTEGTRWGSHSLRRALAGLRRQREGPS